VYVSDDDATTWRRSSSGLPHDEAFDVTAAAGTSRVWVALGATDDGRIGGVYRSDDAGATWRPSGTGLTAIANSNASIRSQYRTVAVAPSDPDTVYTADAGWAGARVYRSQDGGLTWRAVVGPETVSSTPWSSGIHASTIGVDPQNPMRAFVGDDERLLRVDGDAVTDVGAVTEGGAARGTGWNGLVASAIAFAPDDARVALAGWDGANPLVSDGGGTSWRRPLASWDGAGGAYDVAWGPDGRVVALLGQAGELNGVATSTDAGVTWDVAVGGPFPTRGSRAPDGTGWPVAVLALGDRTFLTTVFGTLYRSDDGGGTWRAVGARGLGDLAADPRDASAFYVTASDGLLRGTLDRDELQLLEGSPGGPPGTARVAVSPDGDVILVARHRTDDAGLFRFDGSRWRRVVNDAFVYDAAFDPRNPDRVLMITNDDPYHDRTDASGAWISEDGGKRFRRANRGLPVLRLSAVAFDPDGTRVIVGTAGGGFFAAPLD